MVGRSDFVRLWIRLIGPIILVLVVWRLDDNDALWAALTEARWSWLAAAVALNLPVIHLKVERWRRLLLARGYPYSMRRSYAAVLSSLYLGMLTPGRIGDALRVQYVHREIDTPYSEGLATTLMDRFCDLYVLAAVAALGAAHFATELQGDLVHVTWIAVAVALALPLIAVARGPQKLVSTVLRRFAERWHASLDALLNALRRLIRPAISVAIPLTIPAFAINYLQGWLVAGAMGLGLSYLDVAALMAATSLLGLMPISISGVGVRELFLAVAFPALGLAAAQGVAFGLLIFLCINLATVALGFVSWQVSPPPFQPLEAEPPA